MSNHVVVVTGSEASVLGELPFYQNSTQRIEENPHIISGKEYGNYLPELWQYMKNIALNPVLSAPSPLAEKIAEKGWDVISQTVDGTYKKAGVNVIETHGSLFSGKCMRCQKVMVVDEDTYDFLEDGDILHCPSCGKPRVRPNVTLRGENIMHKKAAEEMVKTATTTVFVGVNPEDDEIIRLSALSARTVLVSPDYGGVFDIHFDMTPQEWVDAGLPIS